jgi:hypothetical protein
LSDIYTLPPRTRISNVESAYDWSAMGTHMRSPHKGSSAARRAMP